MNSSIPDSLNLRDIHLPDAVSWWPPAIGWWVVLALVILVIYLAPKVYRRITYIPLRRVSQQAFDSIKSRYEVNNDPLELIQSISTLLRQISMTYHGREQAAHLTGDEWINSLNTLTEENYFTDSLKNNLINAPYQKNTDIQSIAILDATQKWISALPKKAKGGKQ